jgi:hypothetical protein
MGRGNGADAVRFANKPGHDLTDAQWELIEPLVPTPQGGWPSGDAFAAASL